MEQVALLSIILMIGFCEWREFKLRKDLQELGDQLSKFSVACYARQDHMETEFCRLNKIIEKISADITLQAEKQAQFAESMHKASIDLGTIVQEYEINGIWLGKNRGQVDAYEG